MVSSDILLDAAEGYPLEHDFVELDMRVSDVIHDANNIHGLNTAEVEGIYDMEALKAIERKLIGYGYNVSITYSTPIVDVEDGQPTGKYFATIEIEW